MNCTELVKSTRVSQTLGAILKYLVSNFDEQGENNDDEQVVKDADIRCQGRRQTLSRTPTVPMMM